MRGKPLHIFGPCNFYPCPPKIDNALCNCIKDSPWKWDTPFGQSLSTLRPNCTRFKACMYTEAEIVLIEYLMLVLQLGKLSWKFFPVWERWTAYIWLFIFWWTIDKKHAIKFLREPQEWGNWVRYFSGGRNAGAAWQNDQHSFSMYWCPFFSSTSIFRPLKPLKRHDN